MTIQAQYRFFLQQLQVIYTLNEAAIITDWVFESLAGTKRFDIVKNPTQQFTDTITEQLNSALASLLQHKPVQYVTGEAWFYGMKLKVNENVLIPRPETEELVKLVLDEAKLFAKTDLTILDIGTGSGCIAIAVKKSLAASNVTAIDINRLTLAIAAENAGTQHVSIQFLQADFLDETQWDTLPAFDIIISNPPYIPVNEKGTMEQNVLAYEPHQALFVPDNSPLLFYEKIIAFAGTHLNKNGKIFMETHENFARETAALFAQKFSRAIVKKDMFDKERMVMATY